MSEIFPLAQKPAPRVALVGGQWAQNVGNAFFNLGGEYVLKRVFGEDAVGFFQDQPNYRTLHNKFKGNPETYVDFAQYLDIDYLVVQGPVLGGWIRESWEKAFRALRDNGVKVIFLSSAFFKFTDKEIAAVKSFLEEYPPYLISTRDDRTYGIIKDWLPGVPKYDGIDSGYFLNRCVNPFKVREGFRYITSNFDRYPEPELFSSDPGDKYNSRQVEIEGKTYFVSVPKFLDKYAHKGKIKGYLADYFDKRKLPETFDGRLIVRPEHRFFPHITHKIYRQSNATASDEPWTYINIYANADFTLSDRVHACVATLAFGSPAMLFTPSPRSALFGRVGAGEIRNKLVTLDLGMLHEEQEKEIEWLKDHV
ncbi:polysaccharide pyruvyl transferase family protein [Pseudooceanicola sp. HF7]|uniref:polysaccharide pyruvyl transferase family protein n=1 Tax=Pseudooceanicola sp. HF7 TaxID=2721560 RepID=UPI001430EBD5|nr:polysaccharide pyruvyl transferase family protein [Pseudooceanicola sp. HF7]NIZ10955.1 polysaccharide pyruvyl transferase family protein [Pseudooceanicola sp. HF7]